MAIPKTICDREYKKFIESPTRPGFSAVEVIVSDGAGVIDKTDDISTPGSIYVGCAPSGSLSSDSTWQILRVDTIAGGIETFYADGDNQFDNIWDNRTGLSYS